MTRNASGGAGFSASASASAIRWCCGDRWQTGSVAGGVAGHQVGLAAAAAEVDLAPVAALARLGQPVGPAEPLEDVRREPDVLERRVPHVRELQAGNLARGLTRQGRAVRRHRHEDHAPAVQARLRKLLEIVGQHVHDLQPPGARGQLLVPRRAARARPAPASASAQRGCGTPSRCTACWPAPAGRRPRRTRLSMTSPTRSRLCRCSTTLSVTGNPMRLAASTALRLRSKDGAAASQSFAPRIGIEQAHLQVVEPRLAQTLDHPLVGHGGPGAQVRVQLAVARGAAQVENVAADERLAAGEMKLRDAPAPPPARTPAPRSPCPARSCSGPAPTGCCSTGTATGSGT